MYFVTNKKDINVWSQDLRQISGYSDRDGVVFYEKSYGDSLEIISKEWVSWFNKSNVITTSELKIGDKFKLFDGKVYKVLEISRDKHGISFSCISDGMRIGFSGYWVEKL